jgi:uncharacterized protein (DUF305 family)
VVDVSQREETVTEPDSTTTDEDQPGDLAGDVDGPDEPDPESNELDDEPVPVGLSWPRVAVLGAALTFLGFALAVFLQRDTPPGESSVDVGFVQDMISHHEQAIELSSMESGNGSNATVRVFASEVLIFQSRELGVMDQMLHEWGYSRGDRSNQAMTWMDMAPVPVEEMPGMIPEDRVDEMRGARGAQADALFLELMAEHHVGGLHMAQYAAENADDHDVRELAATMARNQALEVNEYAQTAERLGLPVTIERVPVPEYPGLLGDTSH